MVGDRPTWVLGERVRDTRTGVVYEVTFRIPDQVSLEPTDGRHHPRVLSRGDPNVPFFVKAEP
jgi:hypothetical protein